MPLFIRTSLNNQDYFPAFKSKMKIIHPLPQTSGEILSRITEHKYID